MACIHKYIIEPKECFYHLLTDPGDYLASLLIFKVIHVFVGGGESLGTGRQYMKGQA